MPPRKRLQHDTPKAYTKYLNSKLPTDAFRVSGVCVLFQTGDASLRRLVRANWGSFEIPISKARTVRAVFQSPDRTPAALPRLKRWHSFISKHLLFISDGKRYLLTGYLYDYPWQFHCRSLPDWDSEFIYYYLLEPILLDLLKKHGVLVWHGAAVARDGTAVILPGVSGSGKSTTTLNLLSAGYKFLADDMVLLRSRGSVVYAAGYESDLYLTEHSLKLLPEWKRFKRGGRLKKGTRWKHRIDLADFRPKRDKPSTVKYLLFPHVGKGLETRLEELTKPDALLECLRQTPKEYPASILGPSVLQSQFEIYSSLVSSARCYKIHLGSDQNHVRAILSGLCNHD
ncbi:MAG: hypothetical protein H0U54_11100 [Acidobacteria bacterium]|nr:hypothetical protein [Acidobacteriota bacterium]